MNDNVQDCFPKGLRLSDVDAGRWTNLRNDRLQVSFATHDDALYHKHLQDESCLIVQGKAQYEVNGTSVAMGDYDSGFPFYCRTFADIPHRLTVDGLIQKVSGPYPHEIELPDPKREFKTNTPLSMIRVGEEAFYTADEVVCVAKPDITRLKRELPNTARKRIRLCCHRNTNALLHEMFVLYTKDTYIQPNKHLAKDETFHILEGEADFIFYSDSGDVTEIIPLGTKGSGRRFFVRVPEGVYHTVVMTSDMLVIHESTPGPYVREHTVWAPWAKSQGSGHAR